MSALCDAFDSALAFAQAHGLNFYHVAFGIGAVVALSYAFMGAREAWRVLGR